MGARRLWARVVAERKWQRRVAVVAVAVALALAASVARAPAALESRAEFARAHPARVAHLLADYSTHPHRGAWAVADESGNYSQWSYRVAFECGPRCAGEAAVRAAVAAAGALRHGRAPRHLVRLRERACVRLPLLPWPTLCDETDVEWEVSEVAGGGSAVRESARAWCGAARVASGACAGALRLRRDTLRDALLAALETEGDA